MFAKLLTRTLLPAALLLLAVCASANTVTFDYEAMGTTYGTTTGYAPGDWIFGEDLADVYVTDVIVGGLPYFNYARIDAPFLGFGTGNIVNTNNVGLIVDFGAAGDASFAYLDLGGRVNIQVNGYGAVIEADDFPSLGTFTVAPGVTMSATSTPVGGGIMGVVTLTGPVQIVRIGGQELWLDDIDCANGIGSGTSPCDYEVVYDPQPLGTVYGAPTGYAPGDWAFTEDGIPVNLRTFDASGTPVFNFMRIDPAFAPIGSVHVAAVNNINQQFKISALGITVAEVTFEYLDQGGVENLMVNGAAMYVGDLHLAPAAIAPGITCSVTWTTTALGIHGEVKLTGDVQDLIVGGQEFFMDDVCVVEGGSGGGCDLLVDHESLTIGDAWGAPYATPPGSWMFTEDTIPVFIGEYLGVTGGWYYNYCEVVAAPVGMGTSNVMNMNNVVNLYDIGSTGYTTTSVTFEYADYGGEENLEVNGAPRYVGDMHLAPAAIAPGVTFSVVTWAIPGGIAGKVTLTGAVDKLIIGGQEFLADDICVEGTAGPTPVVWCDHLSDIESPALGSVWGGLYGDMPGDLMFTEDGIDTYIDQYLHPTGIYVFDEARVDLAFAPFGSGQILTLNNVCAAYDFAPLGLVEEVRFEYFDGAGVENLEVNGAGLYQGEIGLAPINIAPGVTCTVYENVGPGYTWGTVVLEGPVQSLLVGGQQFAIDNVCVRLAGSTTDVSPTPSARTHLLPNFPNPFNPSTTLEFSLARDSRVELTIHDVAGRLVRTLVSDDRPAGRHAVVWNGKDEQGGAVAAGIYFVRVHSRDGVDTQKIALIK